jgi:peptidyl-prolyl cis-trans isomerase SurA
MQHISLRLRRALIVPVLALIASVIATGATRAEIIEQVLVKVNGEIFTKTDLETRQVSALRALGQAEAAKKPSDTALRKMLDDLTPQLMVSIIDEMLLVQRGKELGYTLGDEQFKSIVDNIKKENKIETDEAFQSALKQENVTIVELRRNLERQMLVTNVTRNEVLSKITVSEEELRRYYNAHLKDFTTSPSVTLREIMIAAPSGDGGTPAEADARAKAEAIRARVIAGESFEKLAAELSDAPSRANGGLIGPLSLDDLAPQVRQTIEPLKVGEVTAVLRTSTGYQLLKLESSTPRETKPFEQARELVSERVYADKERLESRKHLDKLRQQSIIEWKSPDLQKAYEVGLQRANAAASPPAS